MVKGLFVCLVALALLFFVVLVTMPHGPNQKAIGGKSTDSRYTVGETTTGVIDEVLPADPKFDGQVVTVTCDDKVKRTAIVTTAEKTKSGDAVELVRLSIDSSQTPYLVHKKF